MKQRTIKILAAVFAATPITNAMAADPTPLYANGLDWKPGPTCTYDVDHNGKKARWTFTVSEAAGDKIMGAWNRVSGGPATAVPVVKTDKGAGFTEELSLIHGTPMVAEPAYQWLVFPLEPGKKWNGKSLISGTTAAGKPWKVEVNYVSKVEGWEKLNVADKNSQVLKITTEEKIFGVGASFTGSAKAALWMGDGNCSVKKLEYRNSFKESAGLVLVTE